MSGSDTSCARGCTEVVGMVFTAVGIIFGASMVAVAWRRGGVGAWGMVGWARPW